MDQTTIKAYNIFLTLTEPQKSYLLGRYEAYRVFDDADAFTAIYSTIELLTAGYDIAIFSSFKTIIFDYLEKQYKKIK